jgi:APA family basic amino acid/polyamine antiporter
VLDLFKGICSEMNPLREPTSPGLPPAQLARRVTAFTAACLLISNMIGTGIFGTTGFMARDIGNPLVILLLWVLGGGFALLGAMCYSELGAGMPRAGGEYVYIREAYGPLWGFLSGWTSFTIGFSAAIASNAYLFATHVRQLIPALNVPAEAGGWETYLAHPTTIGLLMVWALTFVHVLGVGAGGFLQRALTTIKVGTIVLFVLAGVVRGRGDWHNLTTSNPGVPFDLSVVLVCFLFVTFSYSGWNAVTYIAGEMAEPGRSIPRATIWGTVVVGVLYLALNVVYFYALPAAVLAGEPTEPVAQKSSVALFGLVAARWITAMLCISILGAASAMIWAGPRVYYAMARDGIFPAMFARTAGASGTPVRSIVLQSLWVSVLILFGGFEKLVIYACSVLILFAALAAGAVLVLRVKRPDLARPYRVAPYPLMPLAYIAISVAVLWAAFNVRPTESLLGMATVLAGVPFYVYWALRAARVETRAGHS